jgi:hypothetical protein
MTTLGWARICVLGLSISGCASRPPEGDIAHLVAVADGNVNVVGFKFADAVVARMDSSVLELSPSVSGGRIRVTTSESPESGAGATATAVGDQPNPKVFTASSVSMRRLSASSLEFSFKELASRDAAGSEMQIDACKLVIDI